MNALRLGSLCTGYAGLDAAVGQVLDVETVWHADPDPGAAAILAHHWPTVPNLGDITAVDWAAVPPVDVLTGGYPCQPTHPLVTLTAASGPGRTPGPTNPRRTP